MATEQDILKMVKYVENLFAVPLNKRDAAWQKKINRDLATLRDDATSYLGFKDQLGQILDALKGLGLTERQVDVIYRRIALDPAGVWTYRFQGRTFSGRSPVPVSIIDSDTGWHVGISELTDAAGETVDPSTVTIAYTVDDATLIALTDNGDGTASFDSALAAAGPSGVTLPASTGIHAAVTNTSDGTSFTLDDVITVVAGSAVTGSFDFTH